MSKMRNWLVALLLLDWGALGLPCCGQSSTFAFQNIASGVDAPVYNADGTRLSGTNYVAVLYGGPSPDALTL